MTKLIKKALVNADGKINAQNVLSLVALGIVLIQQFCKMFGLEFHGQTADIMNFVNTALTMLGVVGLADNTQQIKDVKHEINKIDTH